MKKYIPYLILAALIGAGLLAQKLFTSPVQPAAPPPPSQTSQPATQAPTPTATVVTSSYEPCGYMWAYHNSDELSQLLLSKIKAVDPASSGNVSFYGEDCVYADGHATFSAMETDFYIHKPVSDLTDEEAFGNWISQGLSMVLEIPRDQLQGNYGFVEFRFEKSANENLIVRVPIQQYMDGTHGIKGAALFRMFYTGQ